MEVKKHILTIDIGTGSVRAILFDFEGMQVSESQREWLPKPLPQYPGAQDFDTSEAWKAVTRCIRETLRKAEIRPGSIAGVTSTSMREGMVLYDRDKRELWACPNADARARAESVEMIERGLADRIYRTGGDWPNIISPARFWWIRKHQPEIYGKIAHMSMLCDWALFKLSGEIVTDPSSGSSSGLFDLDRRKWSDDLIGLLGLPAGIYPEVYESGTQIGTVTKKAAEETGLRTGTPVITGGADTQLALLGAGVAKPSTFAVVGGTFWQTALVSDRALVDPKFRLRTLCHAVYGLWMTEGIGFYHGYTMRWFRDGFCRDLSRSSQQGGVDCYSLMESEAETIAPGSNGVHAIFSDIMNARKWTHAAPSFIGFDVLDSAGSGRGACIRAIEENAAYVSRGHMEILEEISGESFTSVVLCGGASKGRLWPKIIAEVLGVEVTIPTVKETSALGAAICALASLGVYRDLNDTINAVIRPDRTIEPDPDTVKRYSELFARWKEVYRRAKAIADDGLLPPLWRAPGT